MNSYRKDRIRPAIKGQELGKLPKCPVRFTDDRASALWADVVFDLDKRGRLDAVVIHIVEQYIDSYSIYISAMDEILKGAKAVSKNRYDKRKNPIFSIRSKALEEMGKIEKLLGFSPYSRDRITVAEKEEEKDIMDL